MQTVFYWQHEASDKTKQRQPLRKMYYQLLGCLEVGRDAVECNVHIQQLD